MLRQLKTYIENAWIGSEITATKAQLGILVFIISCLSVFYFIKTLDKPEPVKKYRMSGQAQMAGSNIYVDVSGLVCKPGVYKVREGSRLFEVIKKAGGFKVGADRDSINLAMVAKDGQKIIISSRSEGESQNKLVNINKASAAELEELPGIGETIAERIVQKRESDGPFDSVDDLQDIEGIGPKKFSQVKELVSTF